MDVLDHIPKYARYTGLYNISMRMGYQRMVKINHYVKKEWPKRELHTSLDRYGRFFYLYFSKIRLFKNCVKLLIKIVTLFNI